MTIYQTSPQTGGRHRKGYKMTKRIKVVINVVTYYDAMENDANVRKVLGPNPTAAGLAEFDQHLFRENSIDWDDLFDRTYVEFIGIEED